MKSLGFELVVLVIVPGPGDKSFHVAFEDLGIRVLYSSGSTGPKEIATTDWLARTITANDIDGVVFVSLPT